MALSNRVKDRIRAAITNKDDADALIAAIDAQGSGPADNVSPLGSTANLSALVPAAASISNSTSTYSIPAEPTGAEVNTAINASQAKVITALGLKADNADVETMRTEVEARLDAIEAKVDLLISKLIAASMMSA